MVTILSFFFSIKTIDNVSSLQLKQRHIQCIIVLKSKGMFKEARYNNQPLQQYFDKGGLRDDVFYMYDIPSSYLYLHYFLWVIG